MTLDALGWDAEWEAEAAQADAGTPGRVVRQDRGWVRVMTADGVVDARTRADRVGTPVVGDWVLLDDDEVTAVLPRRNRFCRSDPVGSGPQVLAANLDQVLVVLGLDRPIKDGRIHRALIQAWEADAPPTIVLTKADVVDAHEGIVDDLRARHPGPDVLAVSAATGAGLDAVAALLPGSTTVLVGESGAGKSTLLNALAGEDHAATGAVRSTDRKGRHTTTRRELHRVEADGSGRGAPDGLVVDTPGLRAIGLYADAEAVLRAFPDVAGLVDDCRFRDCEHGDEPGCAVLAAVEDGSLGGDRLAAFHDLRAEAEWRHLPEHEQRRRRRP